MNRQDFPTTALTENDYPIRYFDSGATSLRPSAVLSAIERSSIYNNANPHRGIYTLSVRATQEYEDARRTVAEFINAETEEVVFTRNATESLNLIAFTLPPVLFQDKTKNNIVIPISEHHSNFVPWQRFAKSNSLELRFLYCDKQTGEIPDSEIETKIDAGTAIVSFATVSNVLGLRLPVEKLTQKAHSVGAVVILDAAQSVAHEKLDVRALDCDLAVFSAHKMYGPFGIGVLYGKKELLDKMPPFLTGGDMIDDVTETLTTYSPVPYKFEAGTQNVSGAAGLAEAVRYIKNLGYGAIAEEETAVMRYLVEELAKLPFITLTIPNPVSPRASVVSFSMNDVHPHDAATVLSEYGVCVRAGKHCAHPLLDYLGVPFRATLRASLGIYNDASDVDALTHALREAYSFLTKTPRTV
ncbi:MAG: SufS family cysteine desulfurase [Oscillospiraceae bacterium]|jgi:cysteine desulfurase/selenocysteine lyase|nr:SufS family cysteine desulfurase [Oscillospiraceae bacterium]